ncbi:8a867f3d-b872-4770-b8b0-cd100491d299 [Thermothielavioides terrestris]|uniref:8a867f3d-b872-4770-b8b0-cd100491d299 n=1 Tax=Thermothielavioides terrestris TaxID=2587410 RepID=A0A3S4AM27_9PEZI|nr:8a867f3d-b872-4770-b8b0-cd100491d299 [Thermothielavioides terrestris]
MAADATDASSKTLSVAEQLEQLNAARKLVLDNIAYYDRIVKGVLPIIGPTAALELRRWGAEFLAESLATPVLTMRDKENITVAVLDTLRRLIEGAGEDVIVLKACVAAAASAYPIALRWIDALLVDATLNCLSILIRTRPATSNRILNAVLNFNPLKLANSPMTPKTRVLVQSLVKTTRIFLTNLLKRDPHNPMSGRIQQYLERLMRSRTEIFDEAGRKRALADHTAAAYGDAKRQKLEGGVAQVSIPPLGPGPHTLAAVFALTSNLGLQGFDATQLPANLAARISVSALATLDEQVLNFAVAGVRDRLASLYGAGPAAAAGEPSVINAATAPLGVEEEDDDYEPDLTLAEDTEQILNKLDNAPPEEVIEPAADAAAALALGPFKLPPPPALDPDTAASLSQAAASRVFGPVSALKDGGAVRKSKAGINRLAASSYDHESWMTLITRLATRSTAGLDDVSSSIKQEDAGSALDRPRVSLGDTIREMLYTYILEDWRRRIEIAVAWLCEEWYNDQLTKRSGSNAPLHYEKWTLRLVDGFLSYITTQDKVLTRFLAEIPELSKALLGKLKGLCADPTTVQLALTSLLYLVMMRPPVREIALDTVADIWSEYEDARPLAAKYLAKWRPGFIESQTRGAQGDAAPANNVAIAA